jgi:4-carboxymuconolactone decarboxylase
MSDRYRRGVDIAGILAPGSLEQFLTSRVAEVAPDFARMAVEFPLGDLYTRDALDLRSREIVAITALAMAGNAQSQLRAHVRAALQLGVSREEVVEILMQCAVYGGFPRALNALADCHDLLTDQNCVATCRS